VVGGPAQPAICRGSSPRQGCPKGKLSAVFIARGITGAKLKSLGNQTIEIKLGNKTYQHGFLVTSLDVDYSGVLGVDILRLMEAKVDLCLSGPIIGRRRYELTGLDCHDLDTSLVTLTTPVVGDRRKKSGLISPEISASYAPTTGRIGAGRSESLVRGELNPDSLFHNWSNNQVMNLYRTEPLPVYETLLCRRVQIVPETMYMAVSESRQYYCMLTLT